MRKSILALLLAAVTLLCSCQTGEATETTTAPTPQETTETTTEGVTETEVETILPITEETTVPETDEPVTDKVTEAITETTPPERETETETKTIVPETETTEFETTENIPAPDTGYLEIECREPAGFATQLFSHQGSTHALSIQLPEDWIIEKRSDTVFSIKRDGNAIGKIISDGDGENSAWLAVKTDKVTANGLDVTIFIEKSTSSEKYRYRITVPYEDGGEQRLLTLTANYEEMSEKALNKLKIYLKYKQVGTLPELGTIDISKSKSKNILILGNSFIRTSQVGAILQEMINECGKDSLSFAYSRGYAHVDTYAYDEEVMSSIRNGDYAVVFICGFYDNSQAEHLAVMKEACDASGTALVIFPAHNEQTNSIKYAYEQVEGVYLLNWKDEVQSFIDNGGDKWDFCINDQHLHSTPMAGYIGAQMIYRAIFGEIPSCSLSATISQSEVNRTLGEYVKTGIIYKTKGATLNFFG